MERRTKIKNMMAKILFQLHGTNEHNPMNGDKGEFYNIC